MLKFAEYEKVEGLKKCKKKAPAHAKKINEPFSVVTMEGTMTGKAGDFLMRGVKGELYVCDAEIFEETYEFTGPLGFVEIDPNDY
jgi:hypothetical protein